MSETVPSTSNEHPVVTAVMAVTPTRFDGVCALNDCALANTDANATEIAARQAAVVLRWAATIVSGYGSTARAAAFLRENAAEINHTTKDGE